MKGTQMRATEMTGRYAPSPTGRLHLGNARTALLSWLQARAAGGRYVLRVEDVDLGRRRPEFERRILADLRWLGLDWDEGPDVGGPCGPYVQRERGHAYAAALARLETYECTCTRQEIRDATLAPHADDRSAAAYPGICRDGPTRPERPRAVRWRTPPGEVCFEDAVAGPHCEDVAAACGDFVLRRNDGAWAYQLAVVVDDAHQRVTDVLRGEDLLDSTPRQILLQRALGLPTPRYAHVPLVLGPDGNKLSKRHGAPDLSTLREAGADPARAVAVLARSAGLLSERVRTVTPRELAPDFDLALVPRVPVTLDPSDLA